MVAAVAAAVVALLVLLVVRGLLGGSADRTSAGQTSTSTTTPAARTSTAAGRGASTTKPGSKPSRTTTSSTRPQPSETSVAGLAGCALRGLPNQAADTVDEIYRGGPYPYRQDGVVFDNRERRLPSEPHGFYHEFTVVTPGSSDRGARRIIVGGADTEAPEVLYYTGNHYVSFCVVGGLD